MELYLTSDKRSRIITETSNFILQQINTRKEGVHAGEEFWAVLGYYGNMEDALASGLKKLKGVAPGDMAKIAALLKRLCDVVHHLSVAAHGFPQPSETALLDGVVVGRLRDNPWR